jgi:acyl-CoA thioesterase
LDKNWYEFFERDRFAYQNGMRLTHIEPGMAEAVMAIEDRHLNAANIVQGGAIFTLADYAFAAASNACGTFTLGVNCTINYFKSPKGRILYAKARRLSSGKKLCTYQVDITDDEGEYIACYTAMGYIKSST